MKLLQNIERDIRNGENLDIYLTLIVSLIVVLLDVFGIIDQSVISSTILACLALISGSLLSNRRSLSNTEEAIIQALQGGKVERFGGRQAYIQYRTERLRKAKRVDDVTWRFHNYSEQTYSRDELDLSRKELEMISELARKRDGIWREVASFRSLEQFNQEKSLVLDPKNIGYNLGYYKLDANAPPRIGFMLIDATELLISHAPKNIRLSIRHPEIVALFSEYFEDIWRYATKLKQGEKVNHMKLEQIETDLQEN